MTTSKLPGATELWREARRLRKKALKQREDLATTSADLDKVLGALNVAGNSGYTLAKELGMERPTVARVLRRAQNGTVKA